MGRKTVTTRTRELLKLLKHTEQNIPKVPEPCAEKDIVKWLRAQPYGEVYAADCAARQFAATLEWPESLANPVVVNLRLRVVAAIDILETLLQTDQACLPDIGKADPLEMLLIDYWRGKGLDWADHRFGR